MRFADHDQNEVTTMMTTPEYLSTGDRIAIVAPAGKIKQKTIDSAAETLKSWGLEVVFGKHLFRDAFQYSATDDERLSDLQKALDDPSIKAVLCARGGYGTVRIIDRINFDRFKHAPKWIIGFSDITVLHAHIHSNLGIETIHSAMAAGIAEEGPAPASLKALLFGLEQGYSFPCHRLSLPGRTTGTLIGGNLAILTGLLGSGSDVDTKGKILFIEEVGEHLYRIDRMMWSLKRAGKLDHLSGLLVGGMTDIPDAANEFGKDAYDIILEHVKEYKYPVCFNFPAGHQPDNRAMIFGRNSFLNIDQQCHVQFHTGNAKA
jgi:muramoyltetrapeptide carboxypeptidase